MPKINARHWAAGCVLLVQTCSKPISACLDPWKSQREQEKLEMSCGHKQIKICVILLFFSTVFSMSTYNCNSSAAPRGCLKPCLNYRSETCWSRTQTPKQLRFQLFFNLSFQWHENFFSPKTSYKCQLQPLQFYKTIKLAASNIQLAVPYIKQSQSHAIVFVATWSWLHFFLSLPEYSLATPFP